MTHLGTFKIFTRSFPSWPCLITKLWLKSQLKGVPDDPVVQELVSVIPGKGLSTGISNHGFWVVTMGVQPPVKEFFSVGFLPVIDTSGHL